MSPVSTRKPDARPPEQPRHVKRVPGFWTLLLARVVTGIGVGGEWVYFFATRGRESRLARVPSGGGEWELLGSDTIGLWSRGAFPTPDGRAILYHTSLDGGSLCRLDLASGRPEVLEPGVGGGCAHPTADRDGTIAFDQIRWSTG